MGAERLNGGTYATHSSVHKTLLILGICAAAAFFTLTILLTLAN